MRQFRTMIGHCCSLVISWLFTMSRRIVLANVMVSSAPQHSSSVRTDEKLRAQRRLCTTSYAPMWLPSAMA
jgi:hypothetical protein